MTLKEHVEALVSRFESRAPAAFDGYDWCQLSAEEERVFSIERERFPRLLVAWMLYQCLSGIVAPEDHGFDAGLIEAEQRARPRMQPKELSEEQFTQVATELAGLTMRECHAMWCKTEFHQLRSVGVKFMDEM